MKDQIYTMRLKPEEREKILELVARLTIKYRKQYDQKSAIMYAIEYTLKNLE